MHQMDGAGEDGDESTENGGNARDDDHQLVEGDAIGEQGKSKFYVTYQHHENNLTPLASYQVSEENHSPCSMPQPPRW